MLSTRHRSSLTSGDAVLVNRIVLFQRGQPDIQELQVAIAVVAMLGFRATFLPWSNDSHNAIAGTGLGVEVEPGNAAIERGTALLVIARFPGRVPAEANLVVEGAAPRPMTRSLDDPAFAGHIPSVDAELSYRVEFPGGRSETFHITVFEHPELRRVNAKLTFPAYTGLDPKTVEDVRHVTAVEGTELTLLCQLNKAVERAVLVDEKGAELALTIHDPKEHVYRGTIKLVQSQRYKVRLTDAEGRTNKLPADISVLVTKNLPPTIAVPRPGRRCGSRRSKNSLKADLKDDYGLVRYGLSVAAFGQSQRMSCCPMRPRSPSSGPARPPGRLRGAKAQPDQVVSYFFWAEDVGTGEVRRTAGDLHFAEVRHFEEIFRQGEQQSREQMEQQQQQGATPGQADQLAEMRSRS